MEVVQYLKKHNVPIKSVGFRYLTEAIKMTVEDGTLPYHMYKLYKPIAKEHTTTTKNVERCISQQFFYFEMFDIEHYKVHTLFFGFLTFFLH